MCFGQSNQSQSMWRIENSPVLILRSTRAFACIRGAPGASLSQRNCPVALNLPSDLRGRQSQHARRARSPEFAAIKALWLDKTSYCFFRAHQCKASAGTRKKNTSTTRSSMKNIKTNLPNSFSSILKKCVAHETAVFQSSVVAAK